MSSPLGQSSSGSGLGNQSSLHQLLTRDLTDMLNEGEGRGRGKVRWRGRGSGLPKLPTLRHSYHTHVYVLSHTHTVTLRNTYIQGDDSLPQCLTEVVDGVIDGILLSIQVEDPVCTAGGEAVSIRCCDGGLNYYLHRQ